jgi:sulfur-oxidizing protein SoxB
MSMNRREFLQILAAASAAGFALDSRQVLAGNAPANYYDLPTFGNVSLMHMTDCHAQLLPIYFREPNVNLGFGSMFGKAPHLVGDQFLKHFGIKPGSLDAHAFTYLDFVEAARTYGKVGGFAHLATLVKKMKASRPGALLLDGGDTWQGSGTALWTNAQDMVDACKLLGVDVMTLHWESSYGAERVKEIEEKDFAGQDRYRRPEREDHRFRGSGVQALRDQEHQWRAGGHRRPGLPLYSDRQPALADAGLELRHP